MDEKKIDEKTEEFDIKDIYTPLSVAKKEIWRRWNDPVLRKKVEDFLGGDLPEVLKKEPKAVLVRYIMTPNHELFYFLDLANLAGMDIALFEYSHDKFVAKNPDKYNLGKIIFHNGEGKKGGTIMEGINVVNFNKNEGKMLDEIKTLSGEKLIDFHHQILSEAIVDTKNKISDISKWFKKSRTKDKDHYYLYYLALFLCNGILFENFLLNKGEAEFTKRKVLPSFRKLEKLFGIKPLIVPLEPFKREIDCMWRHYPKKVKKNFDKYINNSL